MEALEHVLDAFADFVVGVGVPVNNVFADCAVGQAVEVAIKKVEDNRAFAILDRLNVDARRSVEAVPATVVPADKARCIYGGGDALTAGLHGELVVHQEVGAVGVVDLHQATGVQSLLKGAGNAVADQVVLPMGIALVGGGIACRRTVGVIAGRTR